jgi:8-oxo-dGTP diphosphatase
MDGMWGLPGGHGEDKETVRQGAAREGAEELGTTLQPEDLELVHVQCRWASQPDYPHARIGYYFAPKSWDGAYANNEPEKCDGLQFFPMEALPPNIIPQIRGAIESIYKGELYGEFDWNTLHE